jgi:hypothetical protein
MEWFQLSFQSANIRTGVATLENGPLSNRKQVLQMLVIKKGHPMSIEEVPAEQLAELFHHYHQALGQTESSWEQVSQQEKSRLITAPI